MYHEVIACFISACFRCCTVVIVMHVQLYSCILRGRAQPIIFAKQYLLNLLPITLRQIFDKTSFLHRQERGMFTMHPTQQGDECGVVCARCREMHDTSSGHTLVEITPTDSYRQRVFIEPLALYLRARTGTISNVKLHLHSERAVVSLDAPQVLSSQSDSVDTAPSCAGYFSHYVLQVCRRC